MRVIIVSGGTPPSKKLLLNYINKGDLIIGVDKGCNILNEYNIKPDLILGDFDSANKEVIDKFINEGVKVERFRPEKDYTDTDLGYEKAKECGATEILLFGATGTRLDHMLGNIGIMLKALREKISLYVIDDNNKSWIIDKPTTIKGQHGSLISFHAISNIVRKVNIIGAKYELQNYDMTLFEPRAVCNEFIDKDITISFEEGNIMIILPVD